MLPGFKLPFLLFIAVVMLAIAGCGGLPASSGGAAPATDYDATVQALLPPAPVTATATPAPIPTATRMPGAADTPPAPSAATLRPTYTPRARPTYTPHPTPTRGALAGDGRGREAATPFAAYLLDGSQLALADTLGAPTLLAFWAPW